MVVDDLLELHRKALRLAEAQLDGLTAADLRRASPCDGWTLADLLAHMVGQHLGFAAAVRDGTAPIEAYAPTPYSAGAWCESVADLIAAFSDADLDGSVIAIELAADAIPVRRVVAAQLLDTVVHAWDIARSIGRDLVPNEPLLTVTASLADGVPDQARGPGAAFAASLPPTGTVWDDALALLGRRGPATSPPAKE